jgi:predicted metalloprotease with PDZ domain
MAFEPNYRRVYWAGAAIVLMIDVELRKASGGELSLDVLLSRLQARRALFSHSWSARELLTTFDELAGMLACQGVTSRYLEGGCRLPDLAALYGELGIAVDAAGVRFSPAPLTWIRDAIAPVSVSPAATAAPRAKLSGVMSR